MIGSDLSCRQRFRILRHPSVVSWLPRRIRQLAEIYHDLLSREELDQVLERLVKTVRHLIPVASILIAEAQTEERVMLPLVAEGGWPDGFLESRLPFGEGLIGLVVERGRAILCNDAHLDPRAGHVAGTPVGEPEAIISVPARRTRRRDRRDEPLPRG